MSRSRLSRRGLAVFGLTLAMVASLSQQTTAAAAERLKPVDPQKDPLVTGKSVEVLPPITGASEKNLMPADLKVTWPSAAVAEVSVADVSGTGKATRAGNLPVSVAAAAKVQVGMRDRAAADKAGIRGVLLDVRRTDGLDAQAPASLSVDYSGFRYAYGGDWSARLQLVSLPTCVTSTPDKAECRVATPLPTKNDVATGTATAPVKVGKAETVYALDATPEGPTGDYKASDLTPAGKWTVNAQSGNFTWNYPLRTPTVPGELAPQLEMAYSSGSTDGRVASTNNQPGWVGEGWSLWSGYIERSYKTCADDGVLPKTGDMCWETENATLSLRGHSTELVYDPDKKVWRPKADDGTKIEHLFGVANGDDNGEHWRVTTTDGVQYYFGLNRAANNSTWTMPIFGNEDKEPCNKATYETSWCDQAWRWNLDYVVDANDNSASYFYTAEKNKYGRNNAKSTSEYVRGGTLDRIEYGTRRNEAAPGSAPARVVFDVQDRCLNGAACATHNGVNWPDVPWDQECTAATCPKNIAPSFWSTKRLAGVTTQYWNGTAYKDVDKWALTQSYPVPGDGTSPSLWLSKIKHIGLSALKQAEVPEVTFVGEAYANRVDLEGDGLPPMNKFRMLAVNTESGGTINPSYNVADCNPANKPIPDSNGTRCYPIRWTPNLAAPRNDWFVKHTVRAVKQIDRVARNATQVTSYDYEGDAGWAYDPDPLRKEEHRSWSIWRGYEKVQVRKGEPADSFNPQSATRYQYFRGLNGDHKANGTTRVSHIIDSNGTLLNDDEQFAGMVREETVYNGLNGPVTTKTINDLWSSKDPTAVGGHLKAYMVNLAKSVRRTALAGGRWRSTQKKTTYDPDYGMPTEQEDLGDVDRPDDDQCVVTTYARNTAKWIVDKASRIKKTGLPCGTAPKTADDIISDTLMSFDGLGYGAAPERGNATVLQEVNAFRSDNDRGYVIDKTTKYDKYGRVTETADALGRPTKTDYVPDTGLPKTVVETNPAGHKKTTTFDQARNQPVLIEDANLKRTELSYDALGRLEGVWLPGRNRLGNVGPNTRYIYDIRSDKTSSLTTETLKPNDNYVTAHALFDGFLRSRQVQQPTAVGGRLVSDTVYDSRGLEAKANTGYHNIDTPSTNLLVADDPAVPSQTVKSYDGVERETTSSLVSLGTKKWSTTTKYNGDSTEITPPPGGTPTVTFVDAAGRTTELSQLTGTGSQSTKYTYTKSGQLATVTDAAGNLWKNTYDLRGRKTIAVDPDKGTTRTGYDDAGQVVTSTDARDKTVTHVYDLLGRRTETHEGAKTGPLLAKWTFDDVVKGKQNSSSRFVGSDEYKTSVSEFDAGYRPKKEIVTIPAVEGQLAKSYTTTRTYYNDGSLKTVALPDVGDLGAETVSYTYNDIGLPRSTTGVLPYVTQSTYTSLGEPTQYRFAGDVEKAVWSTKYYDVATRRVTDNISQRELVGGMEVGRTKYRHDPIGNITQTKETAPGTPDDKQCFTYDTLRQLKEAWTATNECEGAPGGTKGGPAPYWTSYKYDLAGNRIEEDHHTTALASTKRTFAQPGQPRPHAPATVGAASFGYDPAGNMIQRPGPTGPQTLEWDAEGNMTGVVENGKKTRYVYEAGGSRLIAEDPSGTTLFLEGTEVRVPKATAAKAGAAKAGPVVSAVRYYTHGTTTVASRTSDGVVRFLMADNRNTVGLTVDSETLDPSRRRFQPFGGPRGTAPADWAGQRGYIGGVQDASSGLTRLGARDYDPLTGAFVSTDPIMDTSNPQQLNPYAYSTNNPTSMSDPSGLARIDDGVEFAEYQRNKAAADTAAAAAGRPKKNRGSTVYGSYGDLFGPEPAGGKRVVVHKVKMLPEDQGIIVSRFFIKNKYAAFNMLFGDNREFNTNSDVGYRFLVAWDTWTGDVSITFTETVSTWQACCQNRGPGEGGGKRTPEHDHTPPRDIVVGDGGYWNNSITFDTRFEDTLAFGYKAMNSDLPCCQTEGVVTMSANKSGAEAMVYGEHYPDVEIIQYRTEGARMIGSDAMSSWEEMAAIGDHMGARNKSWRVPN